MVMHMKAKELRDLSFEELDQKLAELKEELLTFGFSWRPVSWRTQCVCGR